MKSLIKHFEQTGGVICDHGESVSLSAHLKSKGIKTKLTALKTGFFIVSIDNKQEEQADEN